MATETDRQQGAGSGQQDDPESDGTLTLTAEQAGALRRARVVSYMEKRRYSLNQAAPVPDESPEEGGDGE